MADTVIKVENLSKLYRLGQVGTGTLVQDINRLIARVSGKEDPYNLVGQVNDRSRKSKGDFVWALKDVNFKVDRGEVLGIIGKNGAGKSTLLKIISQITGPTTGSIKAKGRIASLLEVGTGMHEEMTARENVFLNGAILGMRSFEILSKFDDIIDFAGCAMYVDTPIKRFSSGMRVRLGFAVAAFLEPEILIVDEVLAVGDAEFQRRAIGKMKEVSQSGGRTVLFVSHNMASLKRLCTRSIVMEYGTIGFDGDLNRGVDFYLNRANIGLQKNGYYQGSDNVRSEFSIDYVKLVNTKGEVSGNFSSEESIQLEIAYSLFSTLPNTRLNVSVMDTNHIVIFTTSTHDAEPLKKTEGRYICKAMLPANFFNTGKYILQLQAGIPGVKQLFESTPVIEFEVEKMTGSGSMYNQYLPGVTSPVITWQISKE